MRRWCGFFFSLLLGNKFLQVLPFRRCLSPITEKKLAGNRFQTDKGAIESCSRLLSALMLRMDYVHRWTCTSHFHPHIHLALGSSTEAYFILCRVLSGFINKTRDLSLTTQIWVHWSRNTQKSTWAHIICYLSLYLQLLPDLPALSEYLIAELFTAGFQTWGLWVIAKKTKPTVSGLKFPTQSFLHSQGKNKKGSSNQKKI